MSSDDQPGLIISNTETIRSFLIQASKDVQLSPELKDVALNLSSQTNLPYRSLRNLWVSSHPSTRPDLFSIFPGSGFVFSSPKPRQKSEELVARLRKLAENMERNEYKELVKDITHKDDSSEPFSSYKDQLGFGLHVVLTMFTCYLIGYASFRALFSHSPVMSAAGGILGLVCGMLVETLLFIIRSSSLDAKPLSRPVPNVKKNQ